MADLYFILLENRKGSGVNFENVDPGPRYFVEKGVARAQNGQRGAWIAIYPKSK